MKHKLLIKNTYVYSSTQRLVFRGTSERDENNSLWKENEINSKQTFSHEINIRRLIMMNEKINSVFFVRLCPSNYEICLY